MYGFGDDRNPANDTVNVMEEILVEFIADVVRVFLSWYCVIQTCECRHSNKTLLGVVSNCWWSTTENTIVYRRPSSSFVEVGRCEKARSYGGIVIHAGGYQACSGAVRGIRHHAVKGVLRKLIT